MASSRSGFLFGNHIKCHGHCQPPVLWPRLAACYMIAHNGRLAADQREQLFAALASTSTQGPSNNERDVLLVVARVVADAAGVRSQMDADKALKIAAAGAVKPKKHANSVY